MGNVLGAEAVATVVMAAKRPAAGLHHLTVVPEIATETDDTDEEVRCPACGQPLGEH